MPGAESVTMLFSEWVWMRATPGMVSIASWPLGVPAVTPLPTMRAAVRCAAPIPSPRKMMTFLMPRSRSRPHQPWRPWSSSQPSSSPVDSTVTTEVTVADCPEPSLNVALRWYRPGLLKE
jgi:hypothetical protein